MKSKSRRSVCPVACTLDLIGDRWTLLVVRDLLCGKSQFKEFCASPEGIATNILSDRLGRLQEHRLVERHPSTERGVRYAYRLTDKGMALEPLLQAIADWGLDHIEGTEIRLRPLPKPS